MIELVVFDFDGVFTDGKILFDNDGNVIKHYNVKDGLGISILHKNKINVGVISGWSDNTSQKNILKHLKISRFSLDIHNKLKILKEWCDELNITLDNVAYMGDDINDLEIIKKVKISGCPNDAINMVKQHSKFISKKNGGNGAVREFCELIINKK